MTTKENEDTRTYEWKATGVFCIILVSHLWIWNIAFVQWHSRVTHDDSSASLNVTFSMLKILPGIFEESSKNDLNTLRGNGSQAELRQLLRADARLEKTKRRWWRRFGKSFQTMVIASQKKVRDFEATLSTNEMPAGKAVLVKDEDGDEDEDESSS